MKDVLKKWNGLSLILRIAIGLVIGAILGVAAPSFTVVSLFGTIFVGALKAVAPVLVFILVISAICNAKGGVGKQFRLVIFLYMLTTFIAAAVAVIASFAFPVTLTLADAVTDTAPPSGIGEVMKTLLSNIVANPVGSLVNANYIGILAWAVVFGLALKKAASDNTKSALGQFADAVSQAVRWDIYCNTHCMCCRKSHNCNSDSCTIHIDCCTKWNGYRI